MGVAYYLPKATIDEITVLKLLVSCHMLSRFFRKDRNCNQLISLIHLSTNWFKHVPQAMFDFHISTQPRTSSVDIQLLPLSQIRSSSLTVTLS